MKRNVSVLRVCSASNCCDTEQRSASQPGSVASGTHCIFQNTWGSRSQSLVTVHIGKSKHKYYFYNNNNNDDYCYYYNNYMLVGGNV